MYTNASISVDVGKMPKSKEAEMALLGSILIDSAVFAMVVPVLKLPDRQEPEAVMFYENHRAIYAAMYALYSRDEPIDAVTVYDELLQQKKSSDPHIASYLMELLNAVPTSGNAGRYAQIIKDAWLQRSVVAAASKIATLGYDRDTEALVKSQKLLADLSLTSGMRDIATMQDALSSAWERISDVYDDPSKASGLATGLIDFDCAFGGLRKGHYTILAARPSVGKTSMLLTWTYNMARNGHAVAIFSCEMSKEELMFRLLSMQSGVELTKIIRGQFTDEEFERLSEAFGELEPLPIYIDDTDAITALEMRHKIRMLKSQYDIQAVFVDYIGRMGGDGDDYQRVSFNSKELVTIGKETGVAMVVLSQLNRAIEARKGDDRKPKLSDLRDSGKVEQDADMIIFMDREELYNPETVRIGETDIIVAKNRHGQIGTVVVDMDKKHTTFRDKR